MKKLISILCVILCTLSLAACGGNSALDQAKAEKKAYIEQQKDDNIESIFMNALNVFAVLTDPDRPNQNSESLYTYEALIQLSNEEVEAFLGGVDGHGFKTALESFYLATRDLGGFSYDESGQNVIYSDFSTERNGDQLLAHATVQCRNGVADVELIFSNDLLFELEGGSLNGRATFADLMEKAALNTLIGMGTVFAVLILISLIIACFGVIPKIQAAFAKKEEAPEVPAAPQPVQAAPVVEEEEDDTELVAVIAAAIAAYEGSTNTDGFVVRSIRRR